MKIDDLISDPPDGCLIGLSERMWMRYLADHLHQAEFASGMRVLDVPDVIAFLGELAEAMRIPPSPKVSSTPKPQARWDEEEVKKIV